MAEQLGDPLRVGHVGLASGHIGHVPSVAENDLERSFEHAMHRHPIDACAFHGHVRALTLEKPLAQPLEFVTKRSERTLDRFRRAASPIETTRHDLLFVYIQTGSNNNDHFHDSLLSLAV